MYAQHARYFSPPLRHAVFAIVKEGQRAGKCLWPLTDHVRVDVLHSKTGRAAQRAAYDAALQIAKARNTRNAPTGGKHSLILACRVIVVVSTRVALQFHAKTTIVELCTRVPRAIGFRW